MDQKSVHDRIIKHLTALYGKDQGEDTWSQLLPILEAFQKDHPHLEGTTSLDTLDNLDTLLITYADQYQSPGKPHLRTLAEFFQSDLQGLITGLHLLPFFPYSSDDGFSVIDYMQINPDFGVGRHYIGSQSAFNVTCIDGHTRLEPVQCVKGNDLMRQLHARIASFLRLHPGVR